MTAAANVIQNHADWRDTQVSTMQGLGDMKSGSKFVKSIIGHVNDDIDAPNGTIRQALVTLSSSTIVSNLTSGPTAYPGLLCGTGST